MAGKSKRGKNRRSSNAANSLESATAPVKDKLTTSESTPFGDANGVTAASSAKEPKQGELYPVSVKTQSGGKLELQLNPGDSVMDIRQILHNAPATCFCTCYDLLLCTKDGLTHQLGDYNVISEVADITAGGCSLEMVAAFYDERSIGAHVQRSRELLSLSTHHASLSTSLALEYETTQNKIPGPDTAKTEVPELDGVGFMEDVTDSLGKLISSPSKEIKCVESITFSSFNPPPNYRRLVGDLIYLDVVTLEGNEYCVTGTTRMFYVNSSTGSVLHPRPSKATSEAETLIGLLQKISSKFKKAFHEILECKASAHPFENIQSLLPANSWLGLYPVPDHIRDAARAEDALKLSCFSELIGMQRDWNEELQSCREFPHTTPQERILRDRALYKVTSDFLDAAISGAIGVIGRCIPPINPTDPEGFHMYVHNNILFRFAVDADFEQLSKKHVIPINSKKNCIASLHNLSENVSQAISHGTSEILDGSAAEGNSVLESAPQLSSETQLTAGGQATYASANNDLKGTMAYQDADVPGLYYLAMAIIDYRGHRIVAESVLPGILQGDKSDSLLYGSVDNGKKICWNEDFHSKVLEASKHLCLKEHTVADGAGNAFKLAAPAESKGIVGIDGRHYLVDMMRVTPRDANYTGLGSQFCILRPELIAAFYQAETTKVAKSILESEGEAHAITGSATAGVEEPTKLPREDGLSVSSDSNETMKVKVETVEESVPTPTSPESYEEILFNPNALTEFKLSGSPEEIATDEENVRKASSFLADTVLPKFVQDLCTLHVSPMDGQTLTEALHAHGINVRYIGKVAKGTKHLPHLWDLCSSEIVVRSAKHIFKDVLKDIEDHDLGLAISHFFNCFFGNCEAVSMKGSVKPRTQMKDQSSHHSSRKPRGQTRPKGASGRKHQSLCMNVSSDSIWSDIKDFANIKYQFEFPEDARAQVKKVSVLRNLCRKVGVKIAARKYDLNAAAPFQVLDILDLQPVVKHSVPVCSEAKELVEAGKDQLAEGMHSEALTLFLEALSVLEQVSGPMHREFANCCRYIATVLYHSGDMIGALIQQQKELLINESCLGLDHPDTALSYGNMALFYHGLNKTELALRLMSRALLLLSVCSGPDHPEVAGLFVNVAMMYQDHGKMNIALRYLQEALQKNERLLGQEHMQTAVCYHALAVALNCMGASKLSHQHEKKNYDILVKQFGEDDSRTRESQKWMNIFKMREIEMDAQKQKDQALNAASTQRTIDLLKANPELKHAIPGDGRGKDGSVKGCGMVGEALAPRGRGLDERALAQLRKKAAARGLLALNVVNSAPVDNGAANDQPCDKKDQMPLPQEDSTPLGLVKGLPSLDTKKLQTNSNSEAAL